MGRLVAGAGGVRGSPGGHALLLTSPDGVYLASDPGNPDSQPEKITSEPCFVAQWNPAHARQDR